MNLRTTFQILPSTVNFFASFHDATTDFCDDKLFFHHHNFFLLTIQPLMITPQLLMPVLVVVVVVVKKIEQRSRISVHLSVQFKLPRVCSWCSSVHICRRFSMHICLPVKSISFWNSSKSYSVSLLSVVNLYLPSMQSCIGPLSVWRIHLLFSCVCFSRLGILSFHMLYRYIALIFVI